MSDNPCDPKTRQEKKNNRGSTKEKKIITKNIYVFMRLVL